MNITFLVVRKKIYKKGHIQFLPKPKIEGATWFWKYVKTVNIREFSKSRNSINFQFSRNKYWTCFVVHKKIYKKSHIQFWPRSRIEGATLFWKRVRKWKQKLVIKIITYNFLFNVAFLQSGKTERCSFTHCNKYCFCSSLVVTSPWKSWASFTPRSATSLTALSVYRGRAAYGTHLVFEKFPRLS